MSDITSISSSQRLTSQPRVSLESTAEQKSMAATSEAQEMEKLSLEMDQINHAFTLAKEIRASLEKALHDLNPTG